MRVYTFIQESMYICPKCGSVIEDLYALLASPYNYVWTKNRVEIDHADICMYLSMCIHNTHKHRMTYMYIHVYTYIYSSGTQTHEQARSQRANIHACIYTHMPDTCKIHTHKQIPLYLLM